MKRDYRQAINGLLDLCDTTDLDDLISTLENAAAVCRYAKKNGDEERAARKFLKDISPWFDVDHPMNKPAARERGDG